MTVPRAADSRTWLLTGVTGFLGKVLLEELMRRREELRIARVLVVIRPRRGCGAQERFDREVARSACFSRLAPGWMQWVTVLEADLEQVELPASLTAHPALADVTHVVHAAASIQFNLPLAQAARANVQASLAVLALARTLPRVQRFVYVSTAYVTPHRSGPIGEDLVTLPAPAEDLFDLCRSCPEDDATLLRNTGHPNAYTFTKAIAEQLVSARRGSLPVTIVRPSIVTASSRHPFAGWIDSTAGYAGFVMLTALGHLRALVSDPEARLDLIPVDEVTRRIVHAAVDDTQPLAIRHLTVGPARAPSVRQCFDVTQRFFRANPPSQNGFRPRSVYLGPDDLRFRVADLIWHHLPLLVSGFRSPTAFRRAAKLRARLATQSREFSYFTTRTFDFRSSTPIEAAFDPAAFVETVSGGVRDHLLSRRAATGA